MSIYHRSSQTSGTPQKKTVTDPVVGQNMDTSRPVYRYIKEKCFKKIHRAALVGNVSEVQALLLLHKHGLNEMDWLRRTPLHLAAAYGHSEVVTLLVERKCDLNLYDAKRRTALVKAVQRQKEECVRILLEHGANPNILDKKGNSALHYAAANENESIISRLLLHKANIEARNKNGCTPLLYAVREEKEKIIEFLLSKGANINAVDDLGSSALARAASRDSTDTVRVLLRHGIDCTTKDIFGWTPDKYALKYGSIKTYKIILDYISKEHQENKNNENNKQEEKKENDKRKEENDLAKENAHKDTEKRLPVKLNFEDSCSTFEETVDFEAKVKEGKKHESSDMKLEDVFDSGSFSSGINLQAKIGKTDNQHYSFAMAKDPYSRVPDTGKKTTQHVSASLPESVVLGSTEPVVIPANVVGGRHEPDKNGTRVQDKQKNNSQSDKWSSSESESESQASMKTDVGRLKPYENVTRPVKKTSNEKKEINPTDDSDITQTSETDSMGCDSLYMENENCMLLMEQLCRNFKDFTNFSKCQDLICPHKRLCEIKDNDCKLLKKKYRKMKEENCAIKKELLKTKDINSELKQQNLKQEYDCCNLRDRLRREEEQYRSDVQEKQQLESTLSAIVVELRALRGDLMKDSDSHEREKDLIHKSHSLQDEISVLKLEINTMERENQEKEKTIKNIKEMNDFLQKTMQLSEETLTKTVSQHNEQLLVLKYKNNLLSTQLEYEKQKSETLKTEVESCHRRLNAAIQDGGQSHKSDRDLERHLQGTREECLHLGERLSQLQRENMLLQQKLNEARNKANNEEGTLVNIRGQLEDTIRRLQTENEKQKEMNVELIDECNRLKIRIYKYEEEKGAREAQITPQENSTLSRGTQTTSISQIEARNTNLETENCRLKTELESQRIKLGKYRQLYLEESNTRKSLQISVDTLHRDVKKLTEVNTKPLVSETRHEYVFRTPPPRPDLRLSSATHPINSLNNPFMLDSYLTRRSSTTFPTFNPWP